MAKEARQKELKELLTLAATLTANEIKAYLEEAPIEEFIAFLMERVERHSQDKPVTNPVEQKISATLKGLLSPHAMAFERPFETLLVGIVDCFFIKNTQYTISDREVLIEILLHNDKSLSYDPHKPRGSLIVGESDFKPTAFDADIETQTAKANEYLQSLKEGEVEPKENLALIATDYRFRELNEQGLNEQQLQLYKTLIIFSGALALSRTEHYSKIKENFFSKEETVMELENRGALEQMIDESQQSTRSKFAALRLLTAAATAPFLTVKTLFSHYTQESFTERIKKTAPALSGKQAQKAALVPVLASALQVGYGYPTNISDLLIQITALYPATDDCLDDKDVSPRDKLHLCFILQRFLKDLLLTKENPIETYRDDLESASNFLPVLQVLEKLDLSNTNVDYTRVWPCLIKLNRYQRLSTLACAQDVNLLDASYDLFELSYEKNAATLELIALLTIPNISDKDLALCRRFGGLMQLIDDCEDCFDDIADNLITFVVNYALPSSAHETGENKPLPASDTLYSRLASAGDVKSESGIIDRLRLLVGLIHIELEDTINALCEDKCQLSQLSFRAIHIEFLKKLSKVLEENPQHTLETPPPQAPS